VKSVHFRLRELYDTMAALSATITAYGLNSESTWPYVVLPAIQFNEHAKHTLHMSHSNLIWTAPIVENISRWEDYAQKINNNSDVPTSSAMFTYGKLLQETNEDDMQMSKLSISGSGPFTPVHQMFPSPPRFINTINSSLINYDTMSEVGISATHTVVNNLKKAVISGLLPLSLIRDAYPETIDATDPLSLFVEPIFASFDNFTIVSYIHGLFEWGFLFSEISLEDQEKLIVVDSSCDESFSYLVSQNKATYVGKGDLHDNAFDKYRLSSVIGLKESSIRDDDINESLDAGVCVYTLTIYPTQELRDAFNANPGIYTAIIGLTMASMIGAFFLYDQ
jgi:hypothetical protein